MEPSELAAIYAANVLRHLDRLGIDQSELSRRLGVSRGIVSRSLKSDKPPSGTTIAAVATALGVDVCDLLCKPKPRKGK